MILTTIGTKITGVSGSLLIMKKKKQRDLAVVRNRVIIQIWFNNKYKLVVAPQGDDILDARMKIWSVFNHHCDIYENLALELVVKDLIQYRQFTLLEPEQVKLQ